MKIAALITTLIIGSSTLALAQPNYATESREEPVTVIARDRQQAPQPVVVQRDLDRDNDRDRVKQPVDYRNHYPVPAPVVVTAPDRWVTPITYEPARPSWIALTQPMRMTAGQIVSPASAGRLNTLELKAVKGSSFVNSILIQFVGGGFQKVQLNQRLDARNPTISIDLAGTNRTIKHIEVYGSSKAHSAYQMLAV